MGHFEGERRSDCRIVAAAWTHADVVFTVEVLFKSALWTTLRTIFRQKCTGLHDFFIHNIIFFSGGWYLRAPTAGRGDPLLHPPPARYKAVHGAQASPVLRSNFSLARQRSYCSFFNETTTACNCHKKQTGLTPNGRSEWVSEWVEFNPPLDTI